MKNEEKNRIGLDVGLLEPGALVDHFKVVRLLGRGGMGDVYLARDTRLGRKVALKMIRADVLGDEDANRRFIFEAQVTAQFSHPHIVAIHSVGELRGQPYLALEYLEGQTLANRLQQDPPSTRETLRIGLSIAEALVEAHSHDVLHRDLKPENVLLPKDGRLRVVDFGLAKPLGDPDAPRGKRVTESDDLDSQSRCETQEGTLLGTPLYMAPEQWTDDTISAAADVWALGVILYELLAGHRPFQASGLGPLCNLVCNDPAPPLVVDPEVPTDVVGLVERALNKDPDSRPTATLFVDVLGAHIHGDLTRSFHESGESPFRGLLPFTEQHNRHFFGRESEVSIFVERLRTEPVLPVVGPSGAGKSSFVQAGVIPRLREHGSYLVIQARPGRAPFRHLALQLQRAATAVFSGDAPTAQISREDVERASLEELDGDAEALASRLFGAPARLGLTLNQLAEDGKVRVLLVVDQLEEIYTLVPEQRVRERYMEAICRAADDPEGPVRVVFTLRDDFLGRVAATSVAQEALTRITVLSVPDVEVLHQVLTRPLEQIGFGYDDDELPREMIEAVEGEPACLPLLQFACAKLWERRDSKKRLLLRSSYEAMGGVEGALASHADGMMEGFTSEQTELARRLLLRLVTSDETRQVVPRDELLEGLEAAAGEVLDRLIAGRTVLVRKGRDDDDPELELAHESLIATWSRLARWIDESREEVAFLAEIGQAAKLWDKRGRPDTEVWSGEALHDAAHRAARCESLPQLVEEFLEVGRRVDSRHARKRRNIVIAVIATLCIVAMGLTAMVFESRERRAEAVEQRMHAEARRAEAIQGQAEAQREGARAALVKGRLLEARARLRSALELQDSPLTRALWWRLSEEPLRWSAPVGSLIYSVEVSPDGRRVAAGSLNRVAYLFDVETQTARFLRHHTDQVLDVAFSPDGRLLASVSFDGELGLTKLDDDTFTSVSEGVERGYTIDVSDDSKLVAMGSLEGDVRIWNVDALDEPPVVLKGDSARVLAVAFGADGRSIGAGTMKGSAIIWDVKTRERRATLQGPKRSVMGIHFTEDGGRLATASSDGTIRLWDVASERVIKTWNTRLTPIRGFAFAHDFSAVALGNRDGDIRVWDLERDELRVDLRDPGGEVYGLDFSRDASLLVSGGEGNAVRLWRLSDSLRRETSTGHSDSIEGLVFTSNGERLVSGGFDGTLRFWDVETGVQQSVIKLPGGRIRCVEASPTEEGLFVFDGTDNEVRLWEESSSAVRRSFAGHSGTVVAIAFTPDGSRFATTSFDRSVRLWDRRTGRQERRFEGKTAFADLAMHPEGQLVATSDFDGELKMWRLDGGSEQTLPSGHESCFWGLDFSPNGKMLATGGCKGDVRVRDLESGESREVGQHGGRLYTVRFHRNGKLLGTTSSTGTARLWNIDDGSFIELDHRGCEVNRLVFHPEGRLVATGGQDGILRLWDVKTGRPVWRGPALLLNPPEMLSHRGWTALGPEKARRQGGAQWRRALETRASQADQSPDFEHLCLMTHDGEVELWETETDRRAWRTVAPGVHRVVGLPNGCLVLAGGRATRFDSSGRGQDLATDATAVAVVGEHILLSDSSRIVTFDLAGRELSVRTASPGITAITQADDMLILGFRDGSLELFPVDPSQDAPGFSFEDVAASPVVRLLPGPPSTVIVGYGNGVVGLWSLRNGSALRRQQIHGAIHHLGIRDRRLYAVSELGQSVVIDLSLFDRDYCGLMREVWQDVTVAWEEGLPVERVAPRDHRCSE